MVFKADPMNNKLCHRILLFLLVLLLPAGIFAGDYHITNYGAVSDSMTLNTVAIQSAIDACSAGGGGRVVISAGSFVSGTLVMKDHVELHLERGAVLLGSTNIRDYPEMKSSYRFYGDSWVRQSLIYGEGLQDIGKGLHETVAGQVLLHTHHQAQGVEPHQEDHGPTVPAGPPGAGPPQEGPVGGEGGVNVRLDPE